MSPQLFWIESRDVMGIDFVFQKKSYLYLNKILEVVCYSRFNSKKGTSFSLTIFMTTGISFVM